MLKSTDKQCQEIANGVLCIRIQSQQHVAGHGVRCPVLQMPVSNESETCPL